MNAHTTATPLDTALGFIKRGWNPVLVKPRGKSPIGKKWQDQTITESNAAQFFGADANIGIQLGAKSGGLIDVDLDRQAARDIAPYLLPGTGAIFGRASSRNSHRLYRVDVAEIPDKATIQFKDPVKRADAGDGVRTEHSTLLELRCGGGAKGAQTVAPGSIHETGEHVKWEADGDPAAVTFADLHRAARELAAATLFAQHWPEHGHDARLTLGGFLARCQMPPPRMKLFAMGIAHAVGGDEKEFVRCAEDAAKKFADDGKAYGLTHLREIFGDAAAKAIAVWLGYQSDDDAEQARAGEYLAREKAEEEGVDEFGKTIIRLRVDQLHIAATKGEKALLDSDLQIFQRGGTLVRPIVADVEAAEGRRTKTAQLLKIDPAYMRDILRREAVWRRWDGRSKRVVAADVPEEVALSILARQGEWTFPRIAGVTSCPTMRPDGSIFHEPGFDAVTGLLLMAPPPMPPIINDPSFDDAAAALALLKGLLSEFPFVGGVDRAVALSALITPIVRGAFQVAPMHCASAPTAGSGKSFLFDLAAAISTGQRMPVMSAGASEDELEKRLGAALLMGQPLISLDNVNGALRGVVLCQAIERPLVEIRILGRSERVSIEARGTSIYCNGNNIILHGDLNCRTITTNLDPNEDRPELREFKDDPFGRVLADRGNFIAAALTLCRAYIVAGQPGKAKPLASFGGWSGVVRSALIWLGEADPVASIDAMQGSDPDRVELIEMLDAWKRDLGVGHTKRRTLADVVAIVEEFPSGAPVLGAAIQSHIAGGRERIDANKLGNWLRKHQNRWIDGLRFMNDFKQDTETTTHVLVGREQDLSCTAKFKSSLCP